MNLIVKNDTKLNILLGQKQMFFPFKHFFSFLNMEKYEIEIHIKAWLYASRIRFSHKPPSLKYFYQSMPKVLSSAVQQNRIHSHYHTCLYAC